MMTVTKTKFDNAKIYQLVDNTNSNVYIGSTCRTLKERLSQHKCAYGRFLKGLYDNTRSFEIIKNNDFVIELLENCQVKTKEELLVRERYFVENTKCINKNMPGRSQKEARNQKFECDCGGKFTLCHKTEHIKTAIHKNYLETLKTKEELFARERFYIENNNCLNKCIPGRSRKEARKQYYDNNKEKINQKFDCQCGGMYTYHHKSTHINTKKHQKYLETLK